LGPVAADAIRSGRGREAHDAWKTFINAQCAYEGAKVREGTMRFDGPTSCMLEFISTRTVQYWQITDTAEYLTKIRRQEREKKPR
jgi:uncharacterized protein YecT (DUF1311 family)